MDVSLLRPGHHPHAPAGVVNVRQVGRDQGLDALQASILSVGLLAPLVVVTGADEFAYVVDGNRRFAAIEALVAAGKIPPDADVPVVVKGAEIAREVGLAANVTQAAMHDADRVEAFAELRRAGVAEKDIAVKFAVPVAHVRRLLALGGVSPAVLGAWRDGTVNEDCVKVFTLASHADQDRVLSDVIKERCPYPHSVRRMLGLDQNVEHLLSYVGVKAYRAAGGTVVEDLFGDKRAVSDQGLLASLAGERLEAEVGRRTGEGWAWVARADDLPPGWRWSWQTLKGGRRPLPEADQARYDELQRWLDSDADATDEAIKAAHAEVEALKGRMVTPLGAEDRARSGCVVALGRDGKIDVTQYVVRPDDVPAKTAVPDAPDTPAQPEEKGLPNSLVEALCGTATEAVQATLGSVKTAGLVALLAGALTKDSWASPMKVTLGGVGGPSAEIQNKEAFPALVARLSKMTVDELLVVAAGVAGRGVQVLHREHGSKPLAPADRPSVQALMGLADPAAMETALRERFDGEAFFKSAPKGVTLSIIREVFGEDAPHRVTGSKKKDLVAYAVASVLPTGWLPRELRHPGYAGPGSSVVGEDRQTA